MDPMHRGGGRAAVLEHQRGPACGLPAVRAGRLGGGDHGVDAPAARRIPRRCAGLPRHTRPPAAALGHAAEDAAGRTLFPPVFSHHAILDKIFYNHVIIVS